MRFRILLICLFMMLVNRSYSQDTVAQSSFLAIMKEFTINSVQVKSYEQLPVFINSRFSHFRKPIYISRSTNNYVVSYGHAGAGSHFHVKAFRTDGKEILNEYDFIVDEHRKNWDSGVLSKVQAIVRDFAENSVPVKSYAQLPACIIQYLNQKYNGTFRLSTHRFNASDAGGGPKRRLTYIARLDNSYILSYEHGGIGYHCHSIIFETDGKDVTNVIKLFSGVKHTSVTELVTFIEIGNVFPFEGGDF